MRDHGGGPALDFVSRGRGAIGRHDSRGTATRRTTPILVARTVQCRSTTQLYLHRLRYYERLGEAGIDFAVLYPTMGIAMLQILDDEVRTTLCRLYNEFMADQYRAYGDRFTVAALIPMNSPEEAIGALEQAKVLGSKVGLIASHVHRGIPGQTWPPDDDWAALRIAEWEVYGWIDTFGIDSAYDYDPVSAKAVELKMPLAAPQPASASAVGHPSPTSCTTRSGTSPLPGPLAKSLFLGGVRVAPPGLRWGTPGRGRSRRCGNVPRPGLDMAEAKRRSHPGAQSGQHRFRPVVQAPDGKRPPALPVYRRRAEVAGSHEDPSDDFEAAGINSLEDVRDLFCTPFYWGCEADDPLVGLAFDSRITPLGARVPAFFASDLGHWDVPEFDEPLEEAYELVERKILRRGRVRRLRLHQSSPLLLVDESRFLLRDSRSIRQRRRSPAAEVQEMDLWMGLHLFRGASRPTHLDQKCTSRAIGSSSAPANPSSNPGSR